MTSEELNAMFGNQSEKNYVWGKENGIIVDHYSKAVLLFSVKQNTVHLYLPYLCNSTYQVPDY